MKSTTSQQQLRIHDNCQVSCPEHISSYAQTELGRNPRARLSQTLAVAITWLAISPKQEW